MTFEDEERQLKEVLAGLQRKYARAAKPYVDRLVHIYSLRPLPPIVIGTANLSPEQLEQLKRKFS